MFTLLVWGINMCAPVHAQNKLDSLQHLNEVVVTARAVQKEIFPVQELSGRQLHQLSSHNVLTHCAIFPAYASRTTEE